MKAQGVTDIGRLRSVNQDYMFYSLDKVGNLPNLFIVADGMGGHRAGDMASRYTVENLVALIKNSLQKDAISIISTSVTEVNTMLINKARESDDYLGMGTTLVVATVHGGVLTVANVGDSRLYVLNSEIIQITRDHSFVEELVTKGKLDRKLARTHEKKNIITRAIGAEDHVEPEIFSVDLKKKDRVLMCSDGLTNMVEDSEILKIVRGNADIKEAVDILVDMANDNGGKDNITAMIIEP